MTDQKILTKHPFGKKGRSIALEKYETLKAAIIEALTKTELTHAELFAELEKKLGKTFDGNVGWYAETVKLDLEARGVITRTKTKPPKLQLK